MFNNSQNGANLIYGDCISIMRNLIDEKISVDAIITDPPYNISKENNFSKLNTAKRTGIDFGQWDKNFDLFSWIIYADKLLKNGGNIIIFNSFLNIGNIAKTLENMNYSIKDLIRWIKPNPMPRNMKRRFVSDYELAIWCVKGNKKWTFNNDTTSYLRPEIKCPSPSGREKCNHPTQKPLYLMDNLIKIFTNENDIILDPFMGSGSTGVAAIKNNRNFIGIELDKNYFNISYQRIMETSL